MDSVFGINTAHVFVNPVQLPKCKLKGNRGISSSRCMQKESTMHIFNWCIIWKMKIGIFYASRQGVWSLVYDLIAINLLTKGGPSAKMCLHWGKMKTTQVARLMGPTWGQSGTDRTQVGPMLAPWILLSGNWHWFHVLIIQSTNRIRLILYITYIMRRYQICRLKFE